MKGRGESFIRKKFQVLYRGAREGERDELDRKGQAGPRSQMSVFAPQVAGAGRKKPTDERKRQSTEGSQITIET